MKKRLLSPSLLLALAAALLALAGLAARSYAQPQTDNKIRLMSEALRERDAGDLDGAQRTLDQLAALAPNDPSVQRLRTEVAAQRKAQSDAAARTEAQRAADAAAAQQAAAQAAAAPAPTVSLTPASAPAEAPAAKNDSSAALVDVKIPEPGRAAPPAASAAPTPEQEAEQLARAESDRINNLIAGAARQLDAARGYDRDGRNDDAIATIDAALSVLPVNPLTTKLIADLKKEKASALVAKAQTLVKAGDLDGARAALAAREALAPADSRTASVQSQIAKVESKAAVKAAAVSPEFAAEREATAKLIAKGRAQYVAGDIDGAQATFREIEAQEPDNTVAKGFLLRIANEKAETGALNREKTRAQLLEEVAKGWQRPGIYQERVRETDQAAAAAPLAKKLNEIVLQNFSFTNAEIGQVVTALSEMSEQFDPAVSGQKGVNIVLLDPTNKKPTVTLTLRNAPLKRVLDFVTEAVGYQYEVQADAVIVRPGGETSSLETAFFPITHATMLRMTGIGGGAAASSSGAKDSTTSTNTDVNGEAAAMKNFLQQAGVNFESVPDAKVQPSLAYDGSSIIVTQSARNLERIRNILARYNDVRQVEIESKFLEVQEGALEQLGVDWTVTNRGVAQFDPTTGAPVLDSSGHQVFTPQSVYSTANGVNRSLADAFTQINNVSGIQIVGGTTSSTSSTGVTTSATTGSQNIPFNAPTVPGSVSLGAGANPLASITGFVGEFNVSALVRALSQKQGTDLLSSPKVTVLSGNPANITVAQELRYPQSYGQIQSQVSSGTLTAGGTGGVTVTAGTPQEFTTRNVGVEMTVTPTVEEDDYSISLDLNPKVTEFEGFIEYGGPSVAISGTTSVTVPAGFFQPIFSVRNVSTKVTIWDGATLVMGGLTREEVKKVNDKVPFFGDIPLLGRLFQSKGESSQKRNLLIFVTANLVSPGGSPKKQNLKNTPANSLFQNPTIVTPASAEPRTRSGNDQK
jgi:general secretion pathway protein D